MLYGGGSIQSRNSSPQPNNHRNIMPKSKFIDFKAVKAAITMEQVLEHYGLLHQFKKSGDRLSGPCPIHKGSSPNQFSVSIEKNVWNCFSECKHGGNVLDFIQKMEDVSILAAANKAIEWFHLDPKEMSASSEEAAEEISEPEKNSETPRPKPAARPAPAQESVGPNKPLQFRLDKLQREHSYLTERGLTLETITDFGVGFCDKGMMAGRIAIPINNPEGKVLAYAGRFPGMPPDEETPKYKLPPGFRKSQEIFNLDRAIREPADKPLVIVEGFFDCMKIHQHGYRKVIALMGSTMSATQEQLIRQHTNGNSHVIVMLDENEAGKFGREDIASHLSTHCFVKVHTFDTPDAEPEHLTDEELADIVEGIR
jgi:DNA primase